MIDDFTKRRYVKHPYNCLYCGSEDIMAIHIVYAEYDQIPQVVECQNCGAKWKEIYSLTDIEEIED